jgi:hypothetical protein
MPSCRFSRNLLQRPAHPPVPNLSDVGYSHHLAGREGWIFGDFVQVEAAKVRAC